MYGKIRHIYDGGQNLLAYKKGKASGVGDCLEKQGKDVTAI